ncbi:undecaprenyl-diphosphate phosphatase [Natronomonas marina]|uniref:undecaprenyl-diphosphate phosphatase n=1 Tax=Natronomonas marina TaxID=2961939 RepID=UPI0020C942E0|nr:undecaprenyl-diphosphate phosphatase [Natronomonas marina]
MLWSDLAVALLVGLVQGVLEWLPVSSQGNVALLLTLVTDVDPAVAVDLALFVQVGTLFSATAYYRADIAAALETTPTWRPETAYEAEHADLTFLVVASAATGVVGIPAYFAFRETVAGLAGGVFLAVVGGLLVLTGLLQRAGDSLAFAGRETPTFGDTLLVGALQGLAVLPGVSRSGTTVSVLLLRGYEGPASLRLSFLLSIPASLGAALLVIFTSGGVPGIAPATAAVALATSAVVGYLTIDALVRFVERVPFWAVCVVLGGLAVVGGVALG